MSEEVTLLRAVAAAPDDDAPRFACADWLVEHEHATGRCSCVGGGTDTPPPWCPECRGSGVVRVAARGPRAEFIRLQIQLANTRPAYPADALCDLCNRQAELLSACPEWARHPCPECWGRGGLFDGVGDWDCPTCTGTGDLLLAHRTATAPARLGRRPLVPRHPQFARGFIESVACRLSEALDADGVPTPWAVAVTRELPVTRFRISDREPVRGETGSFGWAPGALPAALRVRVPGPFLIAADARAALAHAAATLAREAGALAAAPGY